MLAYLTRRLLQSLLVLLLMSAAVFFLIGLMPGDPVDLMISGNPDLTSQDAQRLRALYGLDQPLSERYLAWLGNAVSGDFGWSRAYSQPALGVLGQTLVNTLWLMLPALLFIVSGLVSLVSGFLAMDGLLETTSCPLSAKKSRNNLRISALLFIIS